MLKPICAEFLRLAGSAFSDFRRRDPLSLAAATAFFTSFALPPLLIILIQFFGLVVDRKEIRDQLLKHLTIVLGKDSVDAIQSTSRGFMQVAHNAYVSVAGFIFLLFIATTLFNQISQSMNRLWDISNKHRNSWGLLKVRLKSLLAILITGLIFIAHLAVESLQDYLWGRHPIGVAGIIAGASEFLLSNLIMVVWFGLLFRFLANVHPPWRMAMQGALFTALLYWLGQLLLRRFLNSNNIKPIFGYSGSFVQVILYIFYISLIMYYGWMFTRAIAKRTKIQVAVDKSAFEVEYFPKRAGHEELSN